MADGGYSTLKVSTLNGVKVYNVSGGKSVPEWISERKKRALRKDQGLNPPLTHPLPHSLSVAPLTDPLPPS